PTVIPDRPSKKLSIALLLHIGSLPNHAGIGNSFLSAIRRIVGTETPRYPARSLADSRRASLMLAFFRHPSRCGHGRLWLVIHCSSLLLRAEPTDIGASTTRVTVLTPTVPRRG